MSVWFATSVVLLFAGAEVIGGGAPGSSFPQWPARCHLRELERDSLAHPFRSGGCAVICRCRGYVKQQEKARDSRKRLARGSARKLAIFGLKWNKNDSKSSKFYYFSPYFDPHDPFFIAFETIYAHFFYLFSSGMVAFLFKYFFGMQAFFTRILCEG